MAALSLLRLGGPLVMSQWGSSTSGNTTINQFLQPGQSSSPSSNTEVNTQKPAGASHKLWRFVGSISVAGAQQGTMTARVNGVSQATTATVVGTGAGAVITDLTTPILVLSTSLLSVLFKFGTADATATNPRAWLVGALCDSV
jgi:hypothetical protein